VRYSTRVTTCLSDRRAVECRTELRGHRLVGVRGERIVGVRAERVVVVRAERVVDVGGGGWLEGSGWLSGGEERLLLPTLVGR